MFFVVRHILFECYKPEGVASTYLVLACGMRKSCHELIDFLPFESCFFPSSSQVELGEILRVIELEIDIYRVGPRETQGA